MDRNLRELIEDAVDEIMEADMELDTIEERVSAFMVLVDIIDPDLDEDTRDEIEKQMRFAEKKKLH